MDEISPEHPRAESLRIRRNLAKYFEEGIVVPEGLSAHGRGEAFDYLIGERTTEFAKKAAEAGAALMVLAERPVISVNGNAAALVAKQLVELAKACGAKLEVNLFHPSQEREKKIEKLLRDFGADEVLGTDPEHWVRIEEIHSHRRRVDSRGIAVADVVLVPLEDGDRTQALKRLGKKVVAIDLNPLSRTSLSADVTIVDNIVRAVPLMVEFAKELQENKSRAAEIVKEFDNRKNLSLCILHILERLRELSEQIRLV